MKRPSSTIQFSFDIRAAAVVGSRHIFRGASVNRCRAASKGAALAFFRGMAQFRHPQDGIFPDGRIPGCVIYQARSWMHGTPDRRFSPLAA
jgi:hypothetical protein